MAGDSGTTYLRQIDTLFRAGTSSGVTDGELLGRFLLRRDELAEAAFAALVERHGAMVLRVCRQVLADQHDAEDAAQAVFLVLARRAGSIRRRESVASWLHGVALRVAARARRAAGRRRARERRVSEDIGDRPREPGPHAGADSDDDRWAPLHEELERLPSHFRAPLILLHLEGLTQEQAAAQLRLPLGTLQSRSARGRAQLKARLEKRGAGVPAGFLEARALTSMLAAVAPEWAEATVKLALQFSQGKAAAVVAAGAATGELASEFLNEGLRAKLRIALVACFLVAAAAWSAALWTLRQEKPESPLVANKAEQSPRQEPRADAAAKPQPPLKEARRTVRGMVRDEQGRPVAKAWVGYRITTLSDSWELIQPANRIRETKVAYRDGTGNVVPSGPLGRYYELYRKDGNWKPIDPADLRPFDPNRSAEPSPTTPQSAPNAPRSNDARAVNESLVTDLIEIRVMKHRWRMLKNFPDPGKYPRTDSEGRFETVTYFPESAETSVICFASPDFSWQAIHVVRRGDPDQPQEIVLRPIREVRARVIETPEDRPRDEVSTDVWAMRVPGVTTDYEEAIAGEGAPWDTNRGLDPTGGGSPDGKRWLRARLVPGRYRIRFRSETVERLVDIEVPAGKGELVLPDIRLETLACIRMVGKRAAEISATDLQGCPLRLADFRGKVVALEFGAKWAEEWLAGIPRTVRMRKRFKDYPIEFLALHDASITSLAAYRDAVASIAKEAGVDALPFRMLLDQPPAGKGTGPYPAQAGERCSGVTADRYEIMSWPSVFVIDKGGRVVFALMHRPWGQGPDTSFRMPRGGGTLPLSQVEDEPLIREADGKFLNRSGMNALEGALEELLGLPRAHRAPEASKPPYPAAPQANSPPAAEQTKAQAAIVVKGSILGLDGRPIAGAKVSPVVFLRAAQEAKSGPKGEFSLTVPAEQALDILELKVESPGMATRAFSTMSPALQAQFRAIGEEPRDSVAINEKGVLGEPLVLGPGVTVSGRVVRDGKPVKSTTIHLELVESGLDRLPALPKTKTDPAGVFRFEHVLPDAHFAAHAEWGSLERGGIIAPRLFQTGDDGTRSDLGELEVEQGKTLAGRVVFSDGKTPFRNAVLIARPEIGDGAEVKLDETGRFRIEGLPAGPVSVSCYFNGEQGLRMIPDGYRLSPRNKCLSPGSNLIEGQLDRNITDLTILFEPGEAPDLFSPRRYYYLDPTAEADFQEAKAGPITGVPPRSLKGN